MIKNIVFVITIGNLIFSLGCQVESISSENLAFNNDDFQISQYGSEKTFDFATWNIEHFPKDPTFTIPYLSRIIQKIDIDMIAVQEIDKNLLFMTLADSLDGYQGYVSQLPDYGQRLGIIYKSDMISLSDPDQLFTNDDWAFPRPPLVTSVIVKEKNKIVFDFILIVLHLKAFVDAESEGRRREACEKLKKYIDTYLLNGSERDILIVGDFNDELIDPPQENVFKIFLEDSLNYQFLTLPLAAESTYIGNFRSAIDHVLITDDVRDEYQNGSTHILKIDQEFSKYVNYISDHRPVLAQFYVF